MLTTCPLPWLRFSPVVKTRPSPGFHRKIAFASIIHTMTQHIVRTELTIGDSAVEVIGSPGISELDLRKAVESNVFHQWVTNLMGPQGILTPAADGGASCSLKKVTIQSVDMFGQRVGFLKFKAEITDDATGKHIPGIVFARGAAVAVLMLLECNQETYAVLTEQARVPVGRVLLELPAGMLSDDAGDFVGTAAQEVEEEIGIHIKSSDLVNLTDFLHPSTGQQIFPSPGGCDEGIKLMLYRCHVKQEVIDSLKGKQTGLREDGEFIKVHVVPYKSLWRSTTDAKALAAISLYEMGKREGLLEECPNISD
ncbi:hypothetical protein KP509_26G066700 [Ceratopteris richardii]|uniref:Nudix hydrolase domain-containing protein n=1 Tax=Ceratopteris richardii TaxID=49495 RepID=A0A8T2RPI8_CERRI|nr:hypothetical protein KP509_26G066700 [Ceratopteris richardii]